MADRPSKPGFLKYETKTLPKVNSLRLANSLVQITNVPILDKASVLFSPAASAHQEPRSCYNCHFYNERGKNCQLIGGATRIERFTYPPAFEDGSKPIEYWPVCGMWDYGQPNNAAPTFKQPPFDSPEDLGLGWVNAPDVGLPLSGTSCGGANGGDDCDHFIIQGTDKRAAKTGFCRVLQTEVGNLDCCTAWEDDDWVDWQKGQDLLKDLDKRRIGPQGPNPLLPK